MNAEELTQTIADNQTKVFDAICVLMRLDKQGGELDITGTVSLCRHGCEDAAALPLRGPECSRTAQ